MHQVPGRGLPAGRACWRGVARGLAWQGRRRTSLEPPSAKRIPLSVWPCGSGLPAGRARLYWQGKARKGNINEDSHNGNTEIPIRPTGTTVTGCTATALATCWIPMTKAHKALTSKRKRNPDTDHEDIACPNYWGDYFSRASGIHLPGSNLKACLTEAAKLNKLGTEFKRSLLVLEDEIALRYDGSYATRSTGRHAGLRWPKRQGGDRIGDAPPPALPAGWQLVFHIEFGRHLAGSQRTAGRRR